GGEAGGQVGRVEGPDGPDATLAGQQGLPERIDRLAEGRDQAHAGDDDPSRRCSHDLAEASGSVTGGAWTSLTVPSRSTGRGGVGAGAPAVGACPGGQLGDELAHLAAEDEVM